MHLIFKLGLTQHCNLTLKKPHIYLKSVFKSMYLIMFKFGYGRCFEADNYHASLGKNQSSASEEVRQMENRVSVCLLIRLDWRMWLEP